MEAAAAIIGISHFGGELAHSLYKLGVNVASARRQSNKISERMTDYTTILDILEVTLQSKDHVFSRKAEAAILKHCDRSWDLFEEIKALLPPRKDGHGRDEIRWLDKLKWNFRKSRVELLLAELEYTKSDVVLLLVTQLLGQKFRSYKRTKQKGDKKEQDRGREDVQRQTVKANNAIMQHMNVAENLSKLQEAAVIEDQSSRPPSGLDITSKTTSALTLVSRQNEVIASFRQSLMKIEDSGQRQALIIERSPQLLHSLLMQWTDLDIKHSTDPTFESRHNASPRASGEINPQADVEKSSTARRMLSPDNMRTLDAFDDRKGLQRHTQRSSLKAAADDLSETSGGSLYGLVDHDDTESLAGSEWMSATSKLHPDTRLWERPSKPHLEHYKPWVSWYELSDGPDGSSKVNGSSPASKQFEDDWDEICSIAGTVQMPVKQKLNPSTKSWRPPRDPKAEEYGNVRMPPSWDNHVPGLSDSDENFPSIRRDSSMKKRAEAIIRDTEQPGRRPQTSSRKATVEDENPKYEPARPRTSQNDSRGNSNHDVEGIVGKKAGIQLDRDAEYQVVASFYGWQHNISCIHFLYERGSKKS